MTNHNTLLVALSGPLDREKALQRITRAGLSHDHLNRLLSGEVVACTVDGCAAIRQVVSESGGSTKVVRVRWRQRDVVVVEPDGKLPRYGVAIRYEPERPLASLHEEAARIFRPEVLARHDVGKLLVPVHASATQARALLSADVMAACELAAEFRRQDDERGRVAEIERRTLAATVRKRGLARDIAAKASWAEVSDESLLAVLGVVGRFGEAWADITASTGEAPRPAFAPTHDTPAAWMAHPLTVLAALQAGQAYEVCLNVSGVGEHVPAFSLEFKRRLAQDPHARWATDLTEHQVQNLLSAIDQYRLRFANWPGWPPPTFPNGGARASTLRAALRQLAQWTCGDPHVIDQDIAAVRADQRSTYADAIAEWRWGYIDAQGQLIIPPRFSHVGPFREGLAAVSDPGTGMFGYIDRQGVVVIEHQFEHAQDFHEGLAAVCKDGKYGYTDRDGHLVIDHRFEHAQPFDDGLAVISVRGDDADDPSRLLQGYIDRGGTIVIPPQFEAAGPFREGLARVWMPWPIPEWGFIGRDGELVIEPRFDDADDFVGGAAKVRTRDDSSGLSGEAFWIDRHGAPLVDGPPAQTSPPRSRCELDRNEATGRVGYRGADGTLIGSHRFSEADKVVDGLARVAEGHRSVSFMTWGFIRESGSILLHPQFPDARPYSEGRAAVLFHGYVDDAGQFAYSPVRR